MDVLLRDTEVSFTGVPFDPYRDSGASALARRFGGLLDGLIARPISTSDWILTESLGYLGLDWSAQ